MKENLVSHKRIRKIFIAFLLMFFSTAVFAKTVSSPKSVVALSRSVSQMWLLSGGKLSGTTDDALDLENIENAVSVGSLTTCSLEKIVSLNPDLVLLTYDIPLHKKIAVQLKSFGIKTYVVDVKTFDDYAKIMSDFTDITKRKDLYKKNVEEIKQQIEKIILRAEKINTHPTYLFLRVSSVKNKVLKNHFGNEIFENLGLKPILNDESLLDEISIEALVKLNPDYIFIVSQGNQKKAEESFIKAYQSNSAWKTLSAVKENHVKMLPKEIFNYKPNDRWAEAYKFIYEYVYEK